jgi:hypothetical protein
MACNILVKWDSFTRIRHRAPNTSRMFLFAISTYNLRKSFCQKEDPRHFHLATIT